MSTAAQALVALDGAPPTHTAGTGGYPRCTCVVFEPNLFDKLRCKQCQLRRGPATAEAVIASRTTAPSAPSSTATRALSSGSTSGAAAPVRGTPEPSKDEQGDGVAYRSVSQRIHELVARGNAAAARSPPASPLPPASTRGAATNVGTAGAAADQPLIRHHEPARALAVSTVPTGESAVPPPTSAPPLSAPGAQSGAQKSASAPAGASGSSLTAARSPHTARAVDVTTDTRVAAGPFSPEAMATRELEAKLAAREASAARELEAKLAAREASAARELEAKLAAREATAARELEAKPAAREASAARELEAKLAAREATAARELEAELAAREATAARELEAKLAAREASAARELEAKPAACHPAPQPTPAPQLAPAPATPLPALASHREPRMASLVSRLGLVVRCRALEAKHRRLVAMAAHELESTLAVRKHAPASGSLRPLPVTAPRAQRPAHPRKLEATHPQRVAHARAELESSLAARRALSHTAVAVAEPSETAASPLAPRMGEKSCANDTDNEDESVRDCLDAPNSTAQGDEDQTVIANVSAQVVVLRAGMGKRRASLSAQGGRRPSLGAGEGHAAPALPLVTALPAVLTGPAAPAGETVGLSGPPRPREDSDARVSWQVTINEALEPELAVRRPPDSLSMSDDSESCGETEPTEPLRAAVAMIDTSLITPCGDWRVLPNERAPDVAADLTIVWHESDIDAYAAHFFGRETLEWVGVHPTDGPVSVSIVAVDDAAVAFHGLVRTARGFSLATVPRDVQIAHSRFFAKPKPRALLEIVAPELAAQVSFTQARAKALQAELLSIERGLACTHYKFGVLLVRDGQSSEHAMLANCDESADFSAFLSLLGETVPLRGHTGFKGGLDTHSDATGVRSVYTRYEDFELMFHVSTMLPFVASDAQQLQRKRHIGNDVAMIAFLDGPDSMRYASTTLASHFTHVLLVVKRHHAASAAAGETVYQISAAARAGVDPAWTAQLPDPPLLRHGPELAALLLTTMINGERAAYSAVPFASTMTRTRAANLSRVYELAMGKAPPASPVPKSPAAATGSSKKKGRFA